MPILIKDRSQCCGCNACANICPKGAITMQADELGFKYPLVDLKLCVDCGLCEKVCAYKVKRENAEPIAVFSAYHRNKAVHTTSQSGGAFAALAQTLLENGGRVYGAAIDRYFKVKHIGIDSLDDLHLLQGTKYIQSDVSGVYKSVKKDLISGKKVLFCGTPCQVYGIKRDLYIAKVPTDNFYSCDLVCYGVPSPKVFEDWKKVLEKKHHSKISSLEFRERAKPWGKSAEKYIFENGDVVRGNFYTALYFQNLISRPSCHNCMFCNTNRVGDVTLGDFWGIEQFNKEMYNTSGVSLIIVSNPKGNSLLEISADKLMLKNATLSQAVKEQSRLQNKQIKPNIGKELFIENYKKYGILYSMQQREILPQSFKYRVVRFLLRLISKNILI